MGSFKHASLRPVDLARAVGLSTQAVRNYEEDRILPPAARSENGYRRYTRVHLAALEAFVVLAGATSHSSARGVMRAINDDRVDDALEIIDGEHSQLLKDRQTVRTIRSTLADIDSQTLERSPRVQDFTIGDLAQRIGVTSTTLRGWEEFGILNPARQAATGHRVYTREDVRDAELAYLLRRGKRPLSDIAFIIREIRTAGSATALGEAAAQWACRVNEKGRMLVDASAKLSLYLASRE